MKKIVDAFIKAWTPSLGTVTPFASSSSQHSEQNDNHIEHYVKTFPEEQSPSVSSMFRSDLFSEGGEKVTAEKTFDIGESATTDNSYTAPTTSTEPDPLSGMAINKSEVPSGADDVEGKNAYGVTANTTTDAPSAGDTTEPVEKAEAKCPHCGQAMPVEKTDDGDEDDMQKSACEKCGDAMCKCNDMQMDKSEDNESKEPAEDVEQLEKKEFSDTKREELASKGHAMPDGSYPIESENDLKNAIRSWGRGGAKPSVKEHIIRRAKAMGKEELIPENWKNMKKSFWSGAFFPE